MSAITEISIGGSGAARKQHMKGKTNLLLYIGLHQNFAIKSEKH